MDHELRGPPISRTWLEGPETITPAELRALEYMSRGCTREQTADALDKGIETVRSQLRAARYRLRAKNTTHAVAEALRLGLIR